MIDNICILQSTFLTHWDNHDFVISKHYIFTKQYLLNKFHTFQLYVIPMPVISKYYVEFKYIKIKLKFDNWVGFCKQKLLTWMLQLYLQFYTYWWIVLLNYILIFEILKSCFMFVHYFKRFWTDDQTFIFFGAMYFPVDIKA